MTKSKPYNEADISALLDSAARHLVNRILNGQAAAIVEDDAEGIKKGELPIQQEISAFKALTDYYAKHLKLEEPSKKERPFNGHQDEITNVGRGGGAANGNGAATAEPPEPEF